MTQTFITIVLRLNLGCLSLAATPAASHAQRYLVNGHVATEKEERLLVSYGFDSGAWRINGWGISPDATHADFVPEPRLRMGPVCHYVLDVPLDCDEVRVASR
jgi:hypothetical protein